MAIDDILPGGKNAGDMDMEAEEAKLRGEMGDVVDPPDPYEGTELSRDALAKVPEEDKAPAPAPATPEPPPAPAVQDEDRRPVDFGALKAEREKRKDFERRYYELQGQMNAWQQAMQQQVQPQPQPEAPPPDRNVDPLGYMEWMDKRLSAAEQANRQHQEFLQRQHFEVQIEQAGRQAAQAFMQEEPQYPDAFQYLMQNRRAELMAYGANEQQANAAIQQEIQATIYRAVQAGQNPAAWAFAAAKTRGWKPKDAAPAATPPAPAPAPQQPALPSPPVPSKAEAAVSLPAGGRPQPGRVSAEQAANGSWDDFQKHFQEMEVSARGGKGRSVWDMPGSRRRV